jgi:hypothetical protein
VAAVEAPRVTTKEIAHSKGNRAIRTAGNQMDVIAHQAVAEARPLVSLRGDSESHDEPLPVVVVDEDDAPVRSPRREVVRLSSVDDAHCPPHVAPRLVPPPVLGRRTTAPIPLRKSGNDSEGL